MSRIPPSPGFPALRSLFRWLERQGRIQRFAWLTLAAAVTPGTYDGPARNTLAQALCAAAWLTLPGYFLGCVLVSVVLTHVVAVTAASYGLSHLALEAVIRVHVLELLPLAAALFVALRALPATLAGLQAIPVASGPRPQGEVVAYFVANLFAVWVLAIASCVAALVVAYLVLHGFTLWALAGYARVVGQVFSPLVTAALALKVLFFALAVGLVPLSLLSDTGHRQRGGAEMRVMARLLFFLVIIEGASLGLKIL